MIALLTGGIEFGDRSRRTSGVGDAVEPPIRPLEQNHARGAPRRASNALRRQDTDRTAREVDAPQRAAPGSGAAGEGQRFAVGRPRHLPRARYARNFRRGGSPERANPQPVRDRILARRKRDALAVGRDADEAWSRRESGPFGRVEREPDHGLRLNRTRRELERECDGRDRSRGGNAHPQAFARARRRRVSCRSWIGLSCRALGDLDARLPDVPEARLHIAVEAALEQTMDSRRRVGRQCRPVNVLAQDGGERIAHGFTRE